MSTPDSAEAEQHYDFTFTTSNGTVEVHSGRDLARAGKHLIAELLQHLDDKDYIRETLAVFLLLDEVPSRLVLAEALETLVSVLLADTVEHWPPFKQATDAMAKAMLASAKNDSRRQRG